MALSFTEGCEVRHAQALAGLGEKSDLIRFNTFFPSPSKPHRRPQANHASEASWRDSSLWNGLIRAPTRATHAPKNDGDLSALAKRLHPHYFFVLPIAA
jgi:hypothetical protein